MLLTWQRFARPPANPGTARGTFQTPWDVEHVEIEQAPRGRTRLTVLRGERELRVDLGSDAWGVDARPRLGGPALDDFVAGRDLIEAGRTDAGTARWLDASKKCDAAGDRVAALWLKEAARAVHAEATRQPSEAVAAWTASWWTAARLLDARGFVALRHDDPRGAEAAYREEGELIAKNAPDSLAAATLLQQLGRVAEYDEKTEIAKNAYLSALATRQRLAPDSVPVATTLGDLGRVASDRHSAEDLLGRAQSMLTELAPESLEAARVLSDRGTLEFHRGDLLRAQELHWRAYAIRIRLDPGGIDLATSYHWLGNVALRRGDLASAEDFQERALRIQRTLGSQKDVEATLNSLGNIAGTRKDFDEARSFHRQALAIGEKVTPDRVEGLIHNLGEDARLSGNFDEAETLLQRALAMHDRLPAGSTKSIARANTLVNLAALNRDKGDLSRAEQIEKSALAIREVYEPESLHLSEDREVFAGILLAQGRLDEARQAYEQILTIASRVVPGSELEARSLHGLATIARQQGDINRSAMLFGLAVDSLEVQKGKLGSAYYAREMFGSAYAEYYRELLDLQVRLGRPLDALATFERSRARLLLSMLAERDLVLASSQTRALEDEMARADAEYERTQEQIRKGPTGAGVKTTELVDRLASLRSERADIGERLKETSPHYSSLRYPQPLGLQGVRAALDDGTVLLAYSVGKDEALLLAVEPASSTGVGLTVFRLPTRDEPLRTGMLGFKNVFDVEGQSERRVAKREQWLRSIYDVLMRPAESLIAKYDRLLILPDGPLHNLPWAALVRDVKDGKPQYLVQWKPIHVCVSATVYAELKKSRKEAPRDASVLVAGFGDPKYPKLIEKKIAAVKRGDEPADASLHLDDYADVDDPQVRSVARGGFRFEQLPASRAEVEQIAALYAPRSVAYLGPDATEERAKAIGKDVPIIHFATHAVINERFPLDSALVFTIPEHPKEGQDNGLLQAWEIFERMRIDADLVTLSACESGLGKEMGGEGLIGLVRAFQYAGARSVLASLWKVEDKATGELMKRFYKYLKGGKTKDDALRSAQIDLIRSAEYSNPRDWAAFQLNGDWK